MPDTREDTAQKEDLGPIPPPYVDPEYTNPWKGMTYEAAEAAETRKWLTRDD